MKNVVALNRNILAQQNYVRKAQASFFGFYESIMRHYIQTFGTDFNIIIYINENIEHDYYIIPYSFMASLFRQDSMELNRHRWFGDIKEHVMNIRVSKDKVDIYRFYGLPYTVNEAKKVEVSIPEIADYAIENAKREIAVRLGQSKFRRAILKNFKGRCCISGIDEAGLLVASHIIPWADDKARRLDPTNGLCLFTLYDQLFDKGYFSITDEGRIQITKSQIVSKGLQKILDDINGKTITEGRKHKICRTALAYHRERVLIK